jgi:hypothetical protein
MDVVRRPVASSKWEVEANAVLIDITAMSF